MMEEPDPFETLPLEERYPLPLSSGTELLPAVYVLVYGANTALLEPSRRPSALGFADEDEMRQ